MVIPVSIPPCDKVAQLRLHLECMTPGICTSFPVQYNVDLLAEPLRDVCLRIYTLPYKDGMSLLYGCMVFHWYFAAALGRVCFQCIIWVNFPLIRFMTCG